jgi:hypothetical protein
MAGTPKGQRVQVSNCQRMCSGNSTHPLRYQVGTQVGFGWLLRKLLASAPPCVVVAGRLPWQGWERREPFHPAPAAVTQVVSTPDQGVKLRAYRGLGQRLGPTWLQ